MSAKLPPMVPAALRARLVSLRRALRLYRAARGLVLWLALWGIVGGTLLLVLNVSPGAPTSGTPLMVFAALSFAALVVVPPLLPVTPRAVGRLVERRYPDLRDRLLALVDPAPGAATDLMERLALQVTQRLESERLWTSLDLHGLRRLSLAALPCVLTLVLIALACPDGLARLAGRLDVGPPTRIDAPLRKSEKPRPAPLGLLDLAVTVQPPEYTGIPAETHTDGYESLRVIKGTQITVRGKQTDGARALLTVSGRDAIGLGEGEFEAGFAALEDLGWGLRASLGDRSVAAGPFEVRVLPDRAPTVRVRDPGRDLVLDFARPVRLEIAASDDFGLSAVELQYRRGRGKWQALPLGSGGREFTSASLWDITPLNLGPGQVLEYRAIARDNDEISGPKSAVSRTYMIKLAPPPEPDAPPVQIERAQERREDALDRLAVEAREFDQQLQELIRRAQEASASGAAPNLTPGALQEAQRRLESRAEDVRQAMAQAEQALADNPLVSDDLVQKVRELHELMAELMNEDLKRVMEEMHEALKKLGTDQFAQNLERARQAQQEFMDKLDRTIRMLRRAKLEAGLEVLRKYLEQLADRQAELAEQTRKLPEGRPANRETGRQRELADQTDPVAAQVAKLAEEMLEESEQIASELRNAAAELKQQDPAGQMRRAAGALKSGSPNQAGGPQRKAEQALRDAAASMAGAAADLTAADRKAMSDAARRLTRDALAVSDAQEDLLADSRDLTARMRVDVAQSKPRLTELRRRQTAARKGAEGLARQMDSLSRLTPVVPPEFAGRARNLAEQMARAERRIEAGEMPEAMVEQGRTLRGMNDLARDLMDLSQRLGQASAQMALQEYMKRLEEMAQRQKALNQRTQQEGGQPMPGGDKPGSAGQQPVPGPGDLSQLAFEQALIRQALQKLLSGQGPRNLVDQLGGTPAEMEKVEDALRGGKVDGETVERQREILHKMLDAQRSLYSKKKESKERQAEAPKPYKPAPKPPVLRPDQTRPPKSHRERREAGPRDLPLDFERVTREYLERLRR